MRRLFFAGAAPIGFVPLMRELSRLPTGDCHQGANDMSVQYNAAVASLLAGVSTQHQDFHYAFFDGYNALMQYIDEPEANGTYGVNNQQIDACLLLQSSFFPFCFMIEDLLIDDQLS